MMWAAPIEERKHLAGLVKIISQITMRFVVAEGCRLEGQEQGSNPITAGMPIAPNTHSP